MKAIRFTLLITAFANASAACAQDDAAQDRAQAEREREIVLRAETFEMLLLDGQQLRPAQLSPGPVLAYSDPARFLEHAGLWLWTAAGRPQGVLAIEFYPRLEEATDVWTFEAATLRRAELQVQCGDERWNLKDGSGFDIMIDSTPAPKQNRVARLRQMKELARRIQAVTTFPSDGRITLRLLPNPLYRYPESVDGVLDGALFGYVSGTNPEVVCLIEAVQEQDRHHWKCGFAPLTAATLSLQSDDRELWTQERIRGGTRNNYVSGYVPLVQFESKTNE